MKSRYVLGFLLVISLLAGCEGGMEAPPSTQPSDLPEPWIINSEDKFSMSASSTDADMNRVYTLMRSDFGELVNSLVDEHSQSISVNPKEMMDWTVTGTFKGKNLDEVLADVSKQCGLSVSKNSSGGILLRFPGRETDEIVIKAEVQSEETVEQSTEENDASDENEAQSPGEQ